MKIILLQILILTSLVYSQQDTINSTILYSENSVDSELEGKESVNIGDISLQYIIGNTSGILLGLAGIMVQEDDDKMLGRFILGFSIGHSLGTYFSGAKSYRSNSLIPVIISSILGVTISVYINTSGANYYWLLFPSMLAIPSYYLFGKSEKESTALIEFRKDEIHISKPELKICSDKYLPNHNTLKIKLLNISLN